MELPLIREEPDTARTGLVEVTVAQDGDPVVVTVSGKVFYDTYAPLEEVLLRLLARERPHLVVDLSGVPVCDSTGLNLLVRVHTRATAAGGWLRLVGVQPMVDKVLQITNLVRILPVHADLDAAVAGEPTA